MNLALNKLFTIKNEFFDGLVNLRDLNLRLNRTANIEPKSFETLKSLEILNLYGYNFGRPFQSGDQDLSRVQLPISAKVIKDQFY